MICPLVLVPAFDVPLYGYVLKLSGPAWAVGRRGTVKLAPFSPLEPSDAIRLSKGGAATIRRVADYNLVRLTFDDRRNPAKLLPPTSGASPLKRMLAAFGAPPTDYRKLAQAVVRPNDRSAGPCSPYYPVGAILRPPTELRWFGGAPKGTVCALASETDAAAQRRFDVPEGAISLTLTSGAPTFKAGWRYVWGLKAGDLPSGSAGFSVVDGQTAETVGRSLDGIDRLEGLETGEKALVKAQILQSKGLYGDSILLLTAASDVSPSLAALLRNKALDALGVLFKGSRADLLDDALIRQWRGDL